MNPYQDPQNDKDLLEIESLIAKQPLRQPSTFLDQRIRAIKHTAKRTRLIRLATLTTAAAACAAITITMNQNNQDAVTPSINDTPTYASAIQIQSEEVSTQTDQGIVDTGMNQPQYRLINHETNRVIHIQDKEKNAKTKMEIKRQKKIYVPIDFD